MGHASPFACEDRYAPTPDKTRWLTGTPPILGLAALDAAIDLWADVDLAQVATKSIALFDQFHAIGARLGLDCVSPTDPAKRGSHISFRHPHAYGLCQALIARGVIGDFRDPDVLRFGLTPLYLGHEDIVRAGDILADILASAAHLDLSFSKRHAVT